MGLMMADFKASYGEMESMAGRLDSGREEIGDVLRRLKDDVDRLVELGGAEFLQLADGGSQGNGIFGDPFTGELAIAFGLFRHDWLVGCN